jgi:uncharacterized membrane protein
MLHDISGVLFIVALSFAISGTYWVLHQRQLAITRSVTARQALLHFVFLFLIVLLPISTALFGGRGATGPAVIIYGAHLALISLLNLLLWLEVRRSAGVKERNAAFAMPWLGRRLTRKFSKSRVTASDS